MTLALWALIALLLTTILLAVVIRQRGSRIALRAVHRSGARIDRFKLTRKPFIRETLLADPVIADAVKEYAREQGVSEEQAWRRVDTYIDEIVPFFNILTYYKFGLAVSRLLLNFFYKVSAEYSGKATVLPKDSIVV